MILNVKLLAMISAAALAVHAQTSSVSSSAASVSGTAGLTICITSCLQNARLGCSGLNGTIAGLSPLLPTNMCYLFSSALTSSVSVQTRNSSKRQSSVSYPNVPQLSKPRHLLFRNLNAPAVSIDERAQLPLIVTFISTSAK